MCALVWCVWTRSMRQRAECPVVRTGVRRVCNFKGGVVDEGEKTRLGMRREKDERHKKDARGREWVGLNDLFPLAWRC